MDFFEFLIFPNNTRIWFTEFILTVLSIVEEDCSLAGATGNSCMGKCEPASGILQAKHCSNLSLTDMLEWNMNIEEIIIQNVDASNIPGAMLHAMFYLRELHLQLQKPVLVKNLNPCGLSRLSRLQLKGIVSDMCSQLAKCTSGFGIFFRTGLSTKQI